MDRLKHFGRVLGRVLRPIAAAAALGFALVLLPTVPAALAQDTSEQGEADEEATAEARRQAEQRRTALLRHATEISGVYAIHSDRENPPFLCLIELMPVEVTPDDEQYPNPEGLYFRARVLERSANDVNCASMGFFRPITHWTNYWHGQIWLLPGQDEWRIIFFPEEGRDGVYRAPGGYYRGRPQGPIDLMLRKLSREETDELE